MREDVEVSGRDSLFGIPIGVETLEVAVAGALEAIDEKQPQVVFSCANAHSLNVARNDFEFREALIDANQVVSDGSGVILLARLARRDVGPRIIGQQYFKAVMNALERRGTGRVFFFGSSERVLDGIAAQMSIVYPSLTLCGTLSPPFGPWSADDDSRFVARINESRSDVLWVGMTAPKQEKWTFRNRNRLKTPLVGNVGAVFDFFAGTVPECPSAVRRMGAESIFRLAMEPRRMWRRVFISNTQFLIAGIWQEVMGFGDKLSGEPKETRDVR